MHTLPSLLGVEFFPLGNLHDLLPIVGTIAPFAFVICILAIKAIKNVQMQKLRHDTIRMAIDKGQPLPPELLNEPAAKPNRVDDRKAGMILIAVAIGLFLFFDKFDFPDRAAHGVVWLALIPGLIGIALLLNWALTRNERTKSDRQS